MLNYELLSLATEGQLNRPALTAKDLQFRILPPLDGPRGFHRFFSRHGRNLRNDGIPLALAVLSIVTTKSGLEGLNETAQARISDPLYMGLVFGTVAYLISRRLFS